MEQPQVQLRKTTIVEREATKLLAKENIEVGSTVMAEKRSIGTLSSGGPSVLQTNVYGLIMKAVPVHRYDVTIYGYTRTDRQVELTKKVSGDALTVDRRSACREIMTQFKQMHSDVLQLAQNNCIYYDLQAILYSLLQLNVDMVHGSTFPMAVEVPDLPFPRFEVLIKAVPDGDLTLGDLSAASSDAGNLDKTLEQFLNLATSQYIMFNKDEFITFSSSQGFLLNPESHGFRPDDSPFFPDNGSYLAIGTQKGVRFVEGPRGKGGRNVSMVIEVKKTPFHSIQPAIQKAALFISDISNMHNGDADRLTRQLKGLQVETTYGKKQKFVITGISRESAAQKTIFLDENQHKREVTVQQYFAEKYNITLKYPSTPLLEARGRDNTTNFYPMELCIISDNQRVKSHQQTPRQTQEMIKKCAVPPAILRDQNHLITKALNLTENDFLKAANVRFIADPLNVNARVLAPPSFQYGHGFVGHVRPDNFTWQGKNFLIPATCKIWAAYAFSGGARDTINQGDFYKFVDRYLAEARSRGMIMSDPSDIRYSQSDPEHLKSEIRLAVENGAEFVLVAHPDAADDMHAALKLCERDFHIVTQGLKIGTVRNVVTKGQSLTVQNIVNKTNMKMGGLNYTLTVSDVISKEVLGTDTLYIGFGMNHPAGGLGVSENGNGNGHAGNGSDHNGNGSASDNSDLLDNKPPSAVGFAANIGKNCFEFIGDFMFQETRRDEKINLIRHVVKRCVEAFRTNQRKDPQRIMVYRNGCSEGQFALILKYEIPLMKAELAKLGCTAGVTVIVCNKLQNVRFFSTTIDPRAKATEQNIRPGTVIDNCVVHPCYCEFFLNSHRALQGTARTPKYTVLFDDNHLSMDQLQGVTYHLCYGHQIVYMPTSLPSPVYIAIRYAERGSMLYRRYKQVTSSDYEPRKYSELTERLGYENVEAFAFRRINA